MADTTVNSTEAVSTKVTDEMFMMECFKHIQTPAVVDVSGVAKVLNYSNPVSVSNRLSRLKKKFNLRISTTTGPMQLGDDGDVASVVAAATATSTPRKGARATKGPIKAKAATTGDESKSESPSKPARKAGGGRKRKTAADPTPAVVEKQVESTEEEVNGRDKENGENESKADEFTVKPETKSKED
ncbi:hypothetical protein D8B26_006475 [Coccidioides posadasii str. Silveira]|uniref:Myb-like DNA-binding domain-containing protein n=2 Tax=Coccidioides posadasii TaxID=199306 RepID=E9CTC4_COCPS|nr:hypothetical protein CPC735_027940 [Coccidioides posadasii C735 delta SOWgp]EER27458.1 hypothetical protein CPC735_027940 [Coccidioides posadasii C735 delta SOWgp]EFW22916.1 conserved hypothetical protein [Coccidioides posadasii str. Silveira]QVM11831.1 hypothetical protein D8B26_006475 [Coccidioides posadasii str. Silveira]|eukprot:XP_003069603.1 hypothetical protein CPC735_027940 [Coccidioides posadasii C735 delta SOWgp]